jgi:hypothetical protein
MKWRKYLAKTGTMFINKPYFCSNYANMYETFFYLSILQWS